jgi:serine/threonine-protein kinase RsbW/stage II sporulation protein AB (anti-sigma F factor)
MRTDGVRGLDRSFAAEPDSVALARRHVTAWLRASLVEQHRLIGDITLAVAEACNNAVVHAYRKSEGNGDGKAFRLVAERDGTTVSVTVSDDGDGMTPRSDSPGLGLGLPLIATLSARSHSLPPPRGRGLSWPCGSSALTASSTEPTGAVQRERTSSTIAPLSRAAYAFRVGHAAITAAFLLAIA